MIIALSQLADILTTFARAGGGGSPSGGGGAAGGGVVAILYVVAYLPMHFVGGYLRRRMLKSEYWLIGQIVGWGIAGAITLLLALADIWGLIIGAVVLLGMSAGLYGWFPKLRRSKKVIAALRRSASLDPTWDEQAILARASDVFMTYQKDWSARDWKAMTSYTTPEYYRHATLMIAALLQAGRINQVNDPKIKEIAITNLHDSQRDADDMVTVGIIGQANDLLFDEGSDAPLFADTNEFTEYWNFKRIDNQWYLDSIMQATEASWKSQPALQQFARDNDLFYSLDWGWLLIPKRGRLFGRAKFGTSDINNHVIGTYNDTYLLQIYTYDPIPNNTGSYLVAQTNVLKNYGNIVVRRKSWKNFLAPHGLTKISMEWDNFNKKYEVYASSSEGVTSFELLHPAFMEKLEALPFEVNIEVVDTIVYLYAPLKTAKNPPEYYEMMLGVLQEAYKQMRI